MKLHKCLKHAFDMVVHSKLRSWLTIIGIVIGVASVIAIVSLGEGMSSSINDQMGDLGGDLLTLTAGFSRSGGFGGFHRESGGESGGATEEEVVLDRSDLQVLRGISDILLLDTQIYGNVDATYLGETGSARLTGVNEDTWSQITTVKAAQGRLLDSADKNVIIIGGRLADGFFSKPLGINQMITIEGNSFRVVGILDESSTNIYIPIDMAYQVLNDKVRDQYDRIIIKVRDEDNLDATIDKIDNKLMLARHVTDKDKDFTISSNKEFNDTRQAMLSSMTMFLTAIAAVSLIVGAVGIANTMFTSVLEKTKEIGIMKAIGARNKDILVMFLLNACLIGLVGGLIGVIFGIFLSELLPSLMGSTPFARGGTFVSLRIIVVALSVSIMSGLIAGIIPAYQASRLKPVDALRYE